MLGEKVFDMARLLYKHKTGLLIDSREIDQLNAWISESPENKDFFESLSSSESYEYYANQLKRYDVDKAWAAFLKKKAQQEGKIRRLNFGFLQYAAIIILSISLIGGGYFWLNYKDAKPTLVAASNEIVPGHTKATLTLSTGERIELSDKETLDAGRITDLAQNINSERAYSIIETPKGGEYCLKLSDGSVVCLNSQTTLLFPDKFSGDKREIELVRGEIYIDVAPNKEAPFFIKTQDMCVKVLGTKFNLYTYDETYQTTLVSGAVEVFFPSGKTFRLKPSQQLTHKKDGEDATIETVDTSIYTSWVDGTITFKDESLEHIMNSLSRWYDFEVVYENTAIKNYEFGLYLDKHESIDPILRILESTDRIYFEIEGSVIYIKERK